MQDTNVPYIVHEEITVKLERTIKRLWILCIIIFITFVLSNCLWIWYESQWQYVDTTTTNEISQEIDSEGTATIGDININDENE
jgi:hypothetical protein